MPHKDPETKRAYYRRRQMNRVLDRSQPYTVESRYPYPAYLVQDGLWFAPDTGEVVGVAH